MGSADKDDLFVEADSSEVRPALGRRISSPEIEVELDALVPSLPPPPMPTAVTQFAKYDVLGLLATGGMAELYLAREASELSSRLTILKVLRQSLVDSEEFEQMFLREGRVAMQLLHPNICTTYEFGKWRGHFYIAMEYIEGATLRHVLQRAGLRGEQIPIPVVLHVVARVAAALEHAHTARDSSRRRLGVVHRDISPHNIMVRFDGVVKLLDFGVAKVQQGEEETRSDAIKGKFGYLAPEQAVAGPVDPRTDVFALGIVLFESLTGRRLYKRASEYEALHAILEEDVPAIAEELGEHGADIEAIVRKALAKKKEDRHQSAGELQQELEQLLARYDVTSARHVASFIRPLFPDELANGPMLTSDSTVVRRLRPESLHPSITSSVPRAESRRKGVVAAAGISLAALVLGGVLALSSEPAEPATETLEPVLAPSSEMAAPRASETEAEAVVETTTQTEIAAETTETETEVALGVADEGERVDDDEEVDEATRERRRRRRERRRLRNMRPGFTADPGF